MARITIYKNSVLATLVGIFGYIFIIAGLALAFTEEILGGIILALIGVGFSIWAPAISRNKQFKTWKKRIEEGGLVPALPSSTQTAIQIYNPFPNKKTLEYIRSLNPSAAQQISELIAAQKSK